MSLTFKYSSGKYSNDFTSAFMQLEDENILQRILQKDHTVWSADPDEISNRLGWLDSPAEMRKHIFDLESISYELIASGITHVLLLGMGGSSLAAELFASIFSGNMGHPTLSILDSSDPSMILDNASSFDPTTTLYIAASKSGGTVETISLLKYFYNLVGDTFGWDYAGEKFAVITDPGSQLHNIAQEFGFRQIFLNNPNIGGRFSALSHFGLVPAAIVGADLHSLLQIGEENSEISSHLGAFLGSNHNNGVNKTTIILPNSISKFGDWAEQLIAESLGKGGKGVLPVVGEPLLPISEYSADHCYILIDTLDDPISTEFVNELWEANFPTFHITVDDVDDMGTLLYTFELAIAITGNVIGVQPFNQPNVESAKVLAHNLIDTYKEHRKLPEIDTHHFTKSNLLAFIDQAHPGSYISIQAYLHASGDMSQQLDALRIHILKHTKIPTTVGFGPRYLHSTGQLHKGDAGDGLFIQITADDPTDLPVYDHIGSTKTSISFGNLKMAQANGDFEALKANGRKVIRFHLSDMPDEDLRELLASL